MKNGPLLSIWLGIFLTAGALQAASLRIMTWDIEDAYPPEKIPLIARVARDHDIDILALQNARSENLKIQDLIQAEFDKLFGREIFRHRVAPGSSRYGSVIFWNSRKVKSLGAVEEPIPQLKAAQILHGVSGGFDFFLVNVRLRQSDDLVDDDDDEKKLNQASALHKLLKKIGGKNNSNPVILSGSLYLAFPDEEIYDEVMDESEKNPNPAYQRLNSDGLLTFCTREIAVKNPKAFSYVGDVLEGGRLLDHIAANAPAWKRYVHGSTRVVRVDKEHYESLDDYEWNFSDHLPVIAEFKIN